MQLTPKDHALAGSFAGRDPFQPANDPALLFHLTIREHDGTLISDSKWCVDSIEAQGYGEGVGGVGSRVTVRPDVETSYLHGKLRYPHALHRKASEEAKDGWAAAAAIDYARGKALAHEKRAMELQLQRPDPLTVICTGGGRS